MLKYFNTVYEHVRVQPKPPITAALGAGEKTAVLENGGKGSHINDQEKTYLGLENKRQNWVGGSKQRGGMAGAPYVLKYQSIRHYCVCPADVQRSQLSRYWQSPVR